MKTKTSLRMVVFQLCFLLLISGSILAGEKKLYTIGTATAAGTNYQIGAAMATVLNRYIPDAQFSAQATTGANQDIELLRSEDIDLGIINNLVSIDAWDGAKAFAGREPATFLRYMFYVGTWSTHMIASLDSGINKLQDMAGKRVAVGAVGSGVEDTVNRIFTENGLDYVDAKTKPFRVEYMAIGNSSEALTNGQIDAVFDTQLVPASAHTNLMSSGKVKMIGLEPSEVDAILAKHPLIKLSIPKNSYPNQPEDAPTVGFVVHLATRDDFDKDMAYTIIKVLMEHMDELYEIYPTLMVTKDNPMTGATVPVHEGAASYYREAGLNIPDTIRK